MFEPWQMMWLASIAIFAALKLLTWFDRLAKPASTARHLAYLFGWPGMDSATFLHQPTRTRPNAREWILASFKMLMGGIAFLIATQLAKPIVKMVSPGDPYSYWVGWLGMLGLIFLLHFGLFHVLSCVWRSAGIQAVPLMNQPIRANSLAEFWGQRWNLAFRDLTHRYLFRPCQRRLGSTAALSISFLVSGLIHDAVISLPVGAGYGWPTLYFGLQLLGIMFEKSKLGKRIGLGRGAIGWLYCATILIAPISWLFPKPFVLGIIVPMLRSIGSVISM